MIDMNRRALLTAAPAVLLGGCASVTPRPDNATLVRQVTETELAFARTMAERDHAAMASFLADETVFLMGGRPQRGKAAVAEYWKRYYTEPRAPFSWKPDQVQVLDSGALAYSTGPVFDPDGKLIARFYSTWRREEAGVWRIVFDDGCSLARCA
jgi:ketosteroid isomerase-like protein